MWQCEFAVEWCHDHQSACVGVPDSAYHLQTPQIADETLVTHKIKTSRFVRICWRKMGLPLLAEKFASKNWTTVTCAVYDGDVPIMLALRSIWCGERPHGGEVGILVEWSGIPTMFRDGSTKTQSRVPQQRGAVGPTDGSMGGGGQGKDWIQPMRHSHPRREDVIRHLIQSMKQPVDKKKESKGPVPD